MLCVARRGSNKGTRVVRSPLSDLVERFGILALIQHCQELKRRNVIEHLLQEQHAGVGRSMHKAWNRTNDEKQLHRLRLDAAGG